MPMSSPPWDTTPIRPHPWARASSARAARAREPRRAQSSAGSPTTISPASQRWYMGSSWSSSWFFPSKGPKSVSRRSSITVCSMPGHRSPAVWRQRSMGLT